MTCPYCNSNLRYDGAYGRLALHQDGKILGHTYRCPNHEGFQSDEEVEEYLSHSGQTLESLGYYSLDEVVCESATHHVSGSFYTDEYDNLHNGYPC